MNANTQEAPGNQPEISEFDALRNELAEYNENQYSYEFLSYFKKKFPKQYEELLMLKDKEGNQDQNPALLVLNDTLSKYPEILHRREVLRMLSIRGEMLLGMSKEAWINKINAFDPNAETNRQYSAKEINQIRQSMLNKFPSSQDYLNFLKSDTAAKNMLMSGPNHNTYLMLYYSDQTGMKSIDEEVGIIRERNAEKRELAANERELAAKAKEAEIQGAINKMNLSEEIKKYSETVYPEEFKSYFRNKLNKEYLALEHDLAEASLVGPDEKIDQDLADRITKSIKNLDENLEQFRKTEIQSRILALKTIRGEKIGNLSQTEWDEMINSYVPQGDTDIFSYREKMFERFPTPKDFLAFLNSPKALKGTFMEGSDENLKVLCLNFFNMIENMAGVPGIEEEKQRMRDERTATRREKFLSENKLPPIQDVLSKVDQYLQPDANVPPSFWGGLEYADTNFVIKVSKRKEGVAEIFFAVNRSKLEKSFPTDIIDSFVEGYVGALNGGLKEQFKVEFTRDQDKYYFAIGEKDATETENTPSAKVTDTPTPKAGAERATEKPVSSPDEFYTKLHDKPAEYMTWNADNTEVTVHLHNDAEKAHSRIHHFFGPDGKAANGLADPKKYTLKSNDLEYEWDGETWKNTEGKRLLVYDGTKISLIRKPEPVAPPEPEAPAVSTAPTAEAEAPKAVIVSNDNGPVAAEEEPEEISIRDRINEASTEMAYDKLARMAAKVVGKDRKKRGEYFEKIKAGFEKRYGAGVQVLLGAFKIERGEAELRYIVKKPDGTLEFARVAGERFFGRSLRKDRGEVMNFGGTPDYSYVDNPRNRSALKNLFHAITNDEDFGVTKKSYGPDEDVDKPAESWPEGATPPTTVPAPEAGAAVATNGNVEHEGEPEAASPDAISEEAAEDVISDTYDPNDENASGANLA